MLNSGELRVVEILGPISTQENKYGIGPDRNKIEPAHGMMESWSCSADNKRWKKVQSDPIQCLFSVEWKPALTAQVRSTMW